jgi:alkaline phosphatase D
MRSAIRFVVLFLGILIAPVTLTEAAAPLHFPQGVASGDVTPFSAVLWTRVDRGALLTVEVSDDPQFREPAFRRRVFASSSSDFTVKVVVGPLRPDHVYFYRWRSAGAMSETGTFKTAPSTFHSADVRFAYTGDSDGLFSVFGNTFATLDAVRAETPDFFVYLGDTIYADSPLRGALLGLGPAASLEDFRDIYKLNRGFPALRSLLSSTSTYAIWDDHEVQDDYAGQTVDPSLFANGRQAFLEYLPMRRLHLLDDSGCAAPPLFRAFRWGRDVDIFIPDERSCRSAGALSACSFAPGVPDLAPTLPPAVRAAFGGLLPPSPPPGCLEAIFDPARTLLGQRQKLLLQALLLRSTARFKFVINEVPIQQFYALPYDRWEGYGAERIEILNFIRAHNIRNVIFLTTDTHANLINRVFVDRFADPAPIATEIVTGPIATFTFQQEVEAFATRAGLPPAVALAGFNQILSLVGVECRDLNRDSYGLVEVSDADGTATIALKDDAGHLVTDALSGLPCVKTIGP